MNMRKGHWTLLITNRYGRQDGVVVRLLAFEETRENSTASHHTSWDFTHDKRIERTLGLFPRRVST